MTDSPHAELRRLHAIVYGRVQGVNFRSATQHAAVQHGLTGWVRNRSDGAVETIAEGPQHALEAFERFLHGGPSAADVERVELHYSPATGEFRGFNIRW